MLSESLTCLSKEGAGSSMLRREVQASPPVPKNIGGWAGGTTAQAKPDPPLKEGAGQNKTIRPHQRADAGVRGPCHIPLAKYERLCYNSL